MKKKILFVIGTRPEAIKIAPVYNALKRKPDDFDPVLVLTGQHPEMANQILSFFGIKPDYQMTLDRVNFSLTEFTSLALSGVGSLLEKISPDMVFVHGDTSSAFCAALAGYYQKIPVAHLEAGLRTGNKYSPFPEELMRKMIGSLATYHFAPTENAKQALLNEGVSEENIWNVGNSVIDALLQTQDLIEKDVRIKDSIQNDLQQFGITNDITDRFVLITGHRRENFGKNFESICYAIKECAQTHKSYHFVYPVHLNPNVQKPVNDILGGIDNVHLIPPVNYLHFVYLMKTCRFILTDSGGIQEEAPSLRKPVLVMRDTTERPEAVSENCARLVGTDHIVSSVSDLINNPAVYSAMSKGKNPYGDGKTAERIVKILGGQFQA